MSNFDDDYIYYYFAAKTFFINLYISDSVNDKTLHKMVEFLDIVWQL
jgi:hypothetical protein